MNTQLKPTLGTLHLWGIAVGLVISGEYFGWSYGWGVAGTLGFLVTSFMVATMYTCFIFSFTELTTAIPHAGGPFAYSRRAFGEKGGLIAGLATLIEFVFAPPAIALAIGAYLNVQFPALDPKHAAVGAYIVFMPCSLNGLEKLGGGRVQWACHFSGERRKALKAVVSGMFAAGCALFVRQLGAVLPVLPSSRASPLPQWNALSRKSQKPVGAGCPR